MEHLRYVFDTLWGKSIPAKKRIREIELGRSIDAATTTDGSKQGHKTRLIEDELKGG